MLVFLVHTTIASQNETIHKCTNSTVECRPGLMFPVWMPQHSLSAGDVLARAIVYFACLCYIFIGVSIIADRFMAAIEVCSVANVRRRLSPRMAHSQAA
jgi:solute carrier family 8 (sodium/calcium exchanger)